MAFRLREGDCLSVGLKENHESLHYLEHNVEIFYAL